MCRRHGLSIATFYKWKAKCGGLEVSEAKRLKALVADTSLSGARVARELGGLLAGHGRPLMVVSDNGTEFTSMAMLRRSQDRRVDWHYIAPGELP